MKTNKPKEMKKDNLSFSLGICLLLVIVHKSIINQVLWTLFYREEEAVGKYFIESKGRCRLDYNCNAKSLLILC
jgi:hypothetical protein